MSRSANDRGEVGVNYLTKLGSDLEWETLGLFKVAFGSLDAGTAEALQNLKSLIET